MDICGVIDSVKTNAGFAEQQKVNFSGTVLSIVNSFFLLYFVKKSQIHGVDEQRGGFWFDQMTWTEKIKEKKNKTEF